MNGGPRAARVRSLSAMTGHVAIVTDSTASIPADTARQLGIQIAQLELTVGDERNDERRIPHERLAAAMNGGVATATSEPPTPAFFWKYLDAANAGAQAVVSIHLSEKLSQTAASAREAASEVDVPVHVVDSRQSGLGLGYPVIAAAEAAASGASLQGVLNVLHQRLQTSTQMMYVDTLEHLYRGGRLSRTQVAIGRAFALKPVLILENGELAQLARGVGGERALRKAVATAVERAGRGPVDIAVEHFRARDRAEDLLGQLRAQLPQTRHALVEETSAILAAHVGPGALGITVSPVS